LSPSELQKLYHTTRYDQDKLVTWYVPRGITVKLEMLTLMDQHYAQQGKPINDWTQMTSDDFKAFEKERIRGNVKSYVTTQSSAPPSASVSTPSHTSDPVQIYVKGIKRNATQLPTLKDFSKWDTFVRAFENEVKAQCLQNVIDTKYIPPSPQEEQLFEHQNNFLMSVFEKKLQPDMAKAAVRRHFKDRFGAQLVYAEVKKHAEKGTAAKIDSQNILTYLTGVKWGSP